MSKFEMFEKEIKSKTVDDFVNEIKKTLVYEIYKRAVLEGKEDTSNTLQALSLIHALTDEKLNMLMMNVAYDLLFAIVDQKLKAEILNSEMEG